nr:TIGR00296 family protein [Candidatus Sigynarchaeota archaeon]
MGETKFAYTDEEGEFLVKIARESLESKLVKGKEIPVPASYPAKLKDLSGIFVTLRKYNVSHDESLRGCIGIIEGREPIIEGAIHMALAAGLEDPRFPQVNAAELDRIVFEVTAMTPPKLLETKDPERIKASIKIGRDGLIMQKGFSRGLLLPQVPVEQEPRWDVEEFLSYTCRKAWLPLDAWKDPHTKIFTFQGEIFEEESPRGKVVRKAIS